jgi:hypothetical protein
MHLKRGGLHIVSVFVGVLGCVVLPVNVNAARVLLEQAGSPDDSQPHAEVVGVQVSRADGDGDESKGLFYNGGADPMADKAAKETKEEHTGPSARIVQVKVSRDTNADSAGLFFNNGDNTRENEKGLEKVAADATTEIEGSLGHESEKEQDKDKEEELKSKTKENPFNKNDKFWKSGFGNGKAQQLPPKTVGQAHSTTDHGKLPVNWATLSAGCLVLVAVSMLIAARSSGDGPSYSIVGRDKKARSGVEIPDSMHS